MEKSLTKKELIRLADLVNEDEKIDVNVIDRFLTHRFPESSPTSRFMLKVAAAITFFFASVLVVFPEVGEKLIEILPGFFLLPERIAKALDFVWGLVGEPVGEQHLMYHIPNIIIYAFGVAGVRQLWRKINKNNWKDRVTSAQEKLKKQVAEGTVPLQFPQKFSLLFVGDGDQIGKSVVIDEPTIGLTISSRKPLYTDLWGKFETVEGEEGFIRVMDQCNSEEAGEFVLFPVLDQHLFLPGKHDFDVAPHRIDIAVRRIREYEKQKGWNKKRIIIVGDKEQKSNFITASSSGPIESPTDEVSLRSVAAAHENVIVVDPTEETLRRVIEIADGKRILFRASDQGAEKYTAEFYHRLSILGYSPRKEENLIVGYDITDLETEHQVVSQNQPAYLPVILSREVFDELESSYFTDKPYIFVPRLVKEVVKKLVREQ